MEPSSDRQDDAAQLARLRRDVARALRRASASSSDALIAAGATSCGAASETHRLHTPVELEEAVHRSEALTLALRALWNALLRFEAVSAGGKTG